MIVADRPSHLPHAVFQQPHVEELCHTIAVLGLADVVNEKIMFARENSPVGDAVLLKREDLHCVGNGFAPQPKVRFATQAGFQELDEGSESDRESTLGIVELDSRPEEL